MKSRINGSATVLSQFFPPATTTEVSMNTPAESRMLRGFFDIFPSKVLDSKEEVRTNLVNVFEFQKYQCMAFIPKRVEDTVLYFKIDMTRLLLESMDRCFVESKTREARSGCTNIQWYDVQVRLSKPIRDTHHFKVKDDSFQRNNADVRMVFQYKNFYLTKKFFTFGQRQVPTGEVHIIRTTAVPVLYNVAQKKFAKEVEKTYLESRFQCMDQYQYACYVLQPNSQYLVPSGTTYVLMTVQKTLMGVLRVKASLIAKLFDEGVEFQNPELHKYLMLCMEDKAVLKREASKRKFLEEKGSEQKPIRKIDECVEWPSIKKLKKPRPSKDWLQLVRGRPPASFENQPEEPKVFIFIYIFYIYIHLFRMRYL